jgi:hypothetical protein
METSQRSNNAQGHADGFLGNFYKNNPYPTQATVTKLTNIDTPPSTSPSGYTLLEDMIAILSAIPSSIITYVSVNYNLFPSSRSPVIICLAALAIGSTIALHFGSSSYLVKRDKLSKLGVR